MRIRVESLSLRGPARDCIAVWWGLVFEAGHYREALGLWRRHRVRAALFEVGGRKLTSRAVIRRPPVRRACSREEPIAEYILIGRWCRTPLRGCHRCWRIRSQPRIVLG
jgi:hypothetical protein